MTSLNLLLTQNISLYTLLPTRYGGPTYILHFELGLEMEDTSEERSC